jgi:hypothetical protein
VHYLKEPYPEAFERVWAMLPSRGINNPKKAAFKAWSKRLKEGVKPEDLERATSNYCLYARQKGILGTELVLMGSTFFGPQERYEPFLTVAPSPMPKPPQKAPEPEERIDARPFLAELLKTLTGAKKIPA